VENAAASGHGKEMRPRQRRVASMRLILSAVTALLVAGTMAVVGSLALHNARGLLTRELENRLLLEARSLANLGADALLDDFPELTLTPVIREMRRRRGELSLAVVVDRDGVVRGSDDPRMLGKPLTGLNAKRPLSSDLQLGSGERLLQDDDAIYASVPIQRTGGHLLGRAVVGLRRGYLVALLARTRRQLLLLSALLMLLGVTVAVGVMHVLLRPIKDLRQGLIRIGQGDLETPMEVRDHTELGLLAETVNDMAARIRDSQRDMLEKERLSHEMALAHRIQQSLMPEHDLRVESYAIAGSYQAAAEVGGDYYDVFPLPDGRVGILLADVAGKGLSGCLVTSMLAVLVRTLREQHDTPSDLLKALERSLTDSLAPGVFITIFYGILDPRSDELTFASAAHNPLLVHRRATGEVERYGTRGLPLGAIRGGPFAASLHDRTLRLAPGDVVLQYTDGINEAPRAGTDEEFGLDRLSTLLAEGTATEAPELLRRIQEEAGRWQGGHDQMDDQTLVVIARGAEPVSADERSRRVLSWLRNHTAEDVLKALARAHHLCLPARLTEVKRVSAWLDTLPPVARLSPRRRSMLEQGVYELCANIAEHGFAGQEGEIELWWQPADTAPLDGHLLLRDQGRQFDLSAWPRPDLDDPEVRARGRGLGILMLKALLDGTMYLPNTGLGNLNVLRFDPLLMDEPMGVEA